MPLVIVLRNREGRAVADAVLLTEVYSAGEAPIPAADGRALARALRLAGQEPLFVPEVADMPAALAGLTRGGDVVIGMGAGRASPASSARASIS